MPTPIKTIGSTAGSGEVNIVLNGSAASDTAGWATTGTAAVTRLSGSGPLNPVISTALRFSSGGVGDYIEAVYSVPSTLRNVKLKVEWSQTNGGASGDWKLDVLNTANTRYALTTDASGVSSISNASGKYTTTFTTDTSATVKLRFVRVAGSSTLDVTNVIVGPGIQPQGAVVEEWQSYTPTLKGSLGDPTLGTGGVAIGWYRRVGSSIELEVAFKTGTSPTAGTGSYYTTLPSGLTIDFSRMIDGADGGNLQNFINQGSGLYNNSGVGSVGLAPFTNGITNGVFFKEITSGTDLSATYPTSPWWNNSGTGDTIQIKTSLPIAEWAGSGTVNLAQNDVEWAYNTGNVTAAGGSDTTSFGYGPQGTPFLAYNSTSAALTTDFRVQFQTPVQDSDVIDVEIYNGLGWVSSTALAPYLQQGTSYYGIGYERTTNSLSVIVSFGNMGYRSGNATYAGAGNPWSNYSAVPYKWRVRKSSAGAAVGFGIVTPGVSSGLVSASGLPGRTDGGTVASGYVGEQLSSTWTVQTITTGGVTLGTISNVTPGIYLAIVETDVTKGAATRLISTFAGTATYTITKTAIGGDYAQAVDTAAAVLYATYFVRVTASGSILFTSSSMTGSTAPNSRGSFSLVRIA